MGVSKEKEMKRWRKILNTPFVIGDRVRLKRDSIFCDLNKTPLLMILVSKGTILRVVGFCNSGVIVENEDGRFTIPPNGLELIGHEESQEDVEENIRTRRGRPS